MKQQQQDIYLNAGMRKFDFKKFLAENVIR